MKRILLFISIILNFANANSQDLGCWQWTANGTPAYKYEGVLPFETSDNKGDDSLLPEDPYFLLGNYRITAFAHVSGIIELMTAERVWARMNASEDRPNYGSNTADITIDGKNTKLIGIKSLAADNKKCSRSFGVGFASYHYTISNDILCKRTLSVKPSNKAKEGVSELLVSISIKNNGPKAHKITYIETLPVNFVPMGLQMTNRDERAIDYITKTTQTTPHSAHIDITVRPKTFLVLPETEEAFNYEILPPSVYMISDKSVKSTDSTLSATGTFTLKSGQAVVMNYIVGIGQNTQHLSLPQTHPNEGEYAAEWKQTLPDLSTETNDVLRREMLWNAYIMEASAKYNTYFDETFIPQGSVYSYHYGDNIANRDHLQALLPACYTNPQLARTAIRYVLKQTRPDGEMTRGNQGYGYAPPTIYKESDQQLYMFLAVAEYLRITGDYGLLNQPITLYPKEANKHTTVINVLQRQFIYLRDEIGRGPNGLIRLQNSDWSDSFLHKYSPNIYHWRAESHLNSAMAIAVLPRFVRQIKAYAPKDFVEALQSYYTEVEQSYMKDLGERKYSARAYLDDTHRFGTDLVCIEPHSYLLQAESIPTERKQDIYQYIKQKLEDNEPTGLRTRERPMWGDPTQAEDGGIWFSLEYPLALGVASFDKEEAWRLMKKFSFENYTKKFPQYWVGQWTAPDELNSTFYRPGLYSFWIPIDNYRHGFQGFCSHPHTWPLYCYYKLKEKKLK